MPQLPTPGSDEGTWGNKLNDFLSQAHKADGTLADGSVTANTIQDGAIPKAKLGSAVQTSLNNADAAAAGTIADGFVSTAKLADGAVTTAKIADGTIINTDIAAGAAIAKTKLASDVQTSLTAADSALPASQRGATNGVASLVNGRVPISQIASGTPDGSKFIRDDGTLQAVSNSGGGGSQAAVLIWNGSDYTPTNLKANTAVPREFRGPTDPTTVNGVTLANYDTWVAT